VALWRSVSWSALVENCSKLPVLRSWCVSLSAPFGRTGSRMRPQLRIHHFWLVVCEHVCARNEETSHVRPRCADLILQVRLVPGRLVVFGGACHITSITSITHTHWKCSARQYLVYCFPILSSSHSGRVAVNSAYSPFPHKLPFPYSLIISVRRLISCRESHNLDRKYPLDASRTAYFASPGCIRYTTTP
jgi:hypothetical protein